MITIHSQIYSGMVNLTFLGFILVLYKGTPELRSKILHALTQLKAVEILSAQSSSLTIGHMLENGPWSTSELEALILWILPCFDEVLKFKSARVTILNLFKNGMVYIFLLATHSPVKGSHLIRSKLLRIVTKFNVLEVLSESIVANTIEGIFQQTSPAEQQMLLAWFSLEMKSILSNKDARTAFFHLFKNGIYSNSNLNLKNYFC